MATINVNIDSLGSGVSSITNNVNDMQLAITKAKSAATKAVAAFGGTATPVGAKLSSSIQEVDTAQFAKIKETITTLASDLNKVKNSYQSQEDFLLNALDAATGGN